MKYSPKQIEKYQRQKYIAQLEKIGKNLFRLLRNPETRPEELLARFDELMEKLDTMEAIRLDSEYLRESEAHYRRLHEEWHASAFDAQRLEEIREAEMSDLNRLQKMKNRSSYRKDKHRKHAQRDGWETTYSTK
ncbi:hypothetical protein [Nitratifractor sp.]|uniref:hypothetical protein n=1 Tax=Nitratifractor sp. TaxID=2268144 RepID=UPI0025E6C1FE|nr:hypothetical protein [Nitratifractor sp.]